MSNVIVFPKFKKDSPPQSMEELIEKVEETRKEQIEFVLDESIRNIFEFSYMNGFDMSDEEYTKNVGLFSEALKSALYKTAGLHHPFQQLAEEICQDIEEPTKTPA